MSARHEEAIGEALRESVDALGGACRLAAVRTEDRPGDLPPVAEIHELLRLFAEVPTEDVRHAVLALLRAVVDATCRG